MSLADYEKQIVKMSKTEAAARIKKDLAAMTANRTGPTYEPVADTQAIRSLISQGTTNTLGEHDPQLRREIHQSGF